MPRFRFSTFLLSPSACSFKPFYIVVITSYSVLKNCLKLRDQLAPTLSYSTLNAKALAVNVFEFEFEFEMFIDCSLLCEADVSSLIPCSLLRPSKIKTVREPASAQSHTV